MTDVTKDIDKAPIDKLLEDMIREKDEGFIRDEVVLALAGIIRDLIHRLNIQHKAHQGAMSMMFGLIRKLETKDGER